MLPFHKVICQVGALHSIQKNFKTNKKTAITPKKQIKPKGKGQKMNNQNFNQAVKEQLTKNDIPANRQIYNDLKDLYFKNGLIYQKNREQNTLQP